MLTSSRVMNPATRQTASAFQRRGSAVSSVGGAVIARDRSRWLLTLPRYVELGQQRVGASSFRRVVDGGGHHDLVRRGRGAAALDALVDRRCVPDRREPGERGGHGALPLGPRVARRLLRGRQRAGVAGAQPHHREGGGEAELVGPLRRLGGDGRDGQDRARLGRVSGAPGGLELLAVDADGLGRVRVTEVPGEGEPRAVRRGGLRAVQAGPEDPHRRQRDVGRAARR